jgi:hypothetical protein
MFFAPIEATGHAWAGSGRSCPRTPPPSPTTPRVPLRRRRDSPHLLDHATRRRPPPPRPSAARRTDLDPAAARFIVLASNLIPPTSMICRTYSTPTASCSRTTFSTSRFPELDRSEFPEPTPRTQVLRPSPTRALRPAAARAREHESDPRSQACRSRAEARVRPRVLTVTAARSHESSRERVACDRCRSCGKPIRFSPCAWSASRHSLGVPRIVLSVT